MKWPYCPECLGDRTMSPVVYHKTGLSAAWRCSSCSTWVRDDSALPADTQACMGNKPTELNQATRTVADPDLGVRHTCAFPNCDLTLRNGKASCSCGLDGVT